MEKTNHPGFTGAGGDGITVTGRTMVTFRDNALRGKNKACTEMLLAKVTRPILSQGKMCDAGNIVISSKHGCFVVSEDVARPVVEKLMSHAKMTFKRDASTSGLYELDATITEETFQRQV